MAKGGVREREAIENWGNQKTEETDLLELAWSGDPEVGMNRGGSEGEGDKK